MTTRIALLRGVNLGPSRRAAMVDVRGAVETAGFAAVRSLLQSGNLVFDAEGDDTAIEAAIERALRADLGLSTEVMVRAPAQWRAMIAANPFRDEAVREPARLVAMVMKSEPSVGAEARVNAIEGRERARLIGREMFIHYPEGQADSKAVGARLDKALGVRGTARNWNTVVKIAELAGP